MNTILSIQNWLVIESLCWDVFLTTSTPLNIYAQIDELNAFF